MIKSRVLFIGDTEVTKKRGDCTLEEEILRFEKFKSEGINTPEFLGYLDSSKQIGRFERINGTHGLPDDEEIYNQRGRIEGTMIRSGFYHPHFSVSFDDTVLTPDNELYLIDADEQMPITKNGIIIGFYILDCSEDFQRTLLPSMNQRDMLERNVSSEMTNSYLRGYQEGLGKPIKVEYGVPSQREIFRRGSLI
ncbi:MAG: hypothetical protein ACMXYB_05090 [Candidatus Woesearchaeota archaeon]